MAEDENQERIAEVVTRSRLSADLLAAIQPRAPRPRRRIRFRRGQQEFVFFELDEDEAVLEWVPSENEEPPGTDADAGRHAVIIELNNNYPQGARHARARVLGDYLETHPVEPETLPPGPERELVVLARMTAKDEPLEAFRFADDDKIFISRSAYTDHYLFAELTAETLLAIADMRSEMDDRNEPLIYKVWLDRDCTAFIDTSYRTIKCDAGQAAFAARGRSIVWAVADTGVKGDHPHFALHQTLVLPKDLHHRDFTLEEPGEGGALADTDGHGTHVAGIIAGETRVGGDVEAITASLKRRVDDQRSETFEKNYEHLSGAAPEAKLMSLKVLQSRKSGKVSMLLAAIGYVQQVNEYGRNIQVHGLNLSVGYSFDPEWFAAGQSPLCKEVDRLVRSGVVVVAAAGNGGYGTVMTLSSQAERAAHASTIADPGNAELAITVGATHRDRPHEYGVSYFSAKGPTADGRRKPDLVAPGERIVSCAIDNDPAGPGVARFREETGTSMAAPHVSAAIAAFLSVRTEFIGKPERIKALFMENATDLGRRPDFQGRGLIDLMRTLQAV